MNSEQNFAPIAALNLDPIKVKLMHKESGEGWSRSYTDAVEFEYRRFLYLVKKFPKEQAAPLFDVDVFWHYHILDTMKYAADCEAVFGYFLHHFPYVGLRGDEDVKAHQRVGERMRELYEQTYGEKYNRLSASAHSAVSDKIAFSVPASKVAFSLPNSNFASAFPPARFAFSIPANTSVPSGAAVGTGYFEAQARASAAMFYSVRPTLSSVE
jgi:hypothetical protein